jgi:hypothetical protein
MNWKVWVRTTGEDSWATNSMVYATREEAEEAAKDLYCRWMAVKEWSVRASNDPVYPVKKEEVKA